uniref:Serpentine Receptor, class T n=1 Tax=Caenorhabditis tropicalis TaxID=1561998 RepID=A0A1I7TYT1_9PELO
MNSSNSSSLFHLNPDIEMRFFGFTYCIVAMFLPPLFFIVIKAVNQLDRESPNMAYELMNIINCSQLTQSITHFLTGPGLIFPNIVKRYGFIVNVIGCTMNTFWIADFPMITLLAVGRILIFTNRIKAQKFPIYMKIFIFLSWSWITFVLIYGSITQNLIFVSPGWDYDFTVPYAEMFSDLEKSLSLTCLAISYVSYILMAILIYKRKSIMICASSRKNEIAILLQSTFVTTYITAMIFAWHQALFSVVSFFDVENKRNQAILNCCLIFHCYVNPSMTLICNKSIRLSCYKILGIRRKIYAVSRTENTSKLSSVNPTVTVTNAF